MSLIITADHALKPMPDAEPINTRKGPPMATSTPTTHSSILTFLDEADGIDPQTLTQILEQGWMTSAGGRIPVLLLDRDRPLPGGLARFAPAGRTVQETHTIELHKRITQFKQPSGLNLPRSYVHAQIGQAIMRQTQRASSANPDVIHVFSCLSPLTVHVMAEALIHHQSENPAHMVLIIDKDSLTPDATGALRVAIDETKTAMLH